MSSTLAPPADLDGPPRTVARGAGAVPGVARIRMMGVDFGVLSEAEVVDLFVDRAATGLGSWIITANLDHLRRYASEPETRALIGAADVVVADGMPLVVASRIAGVPLPERVAGSSMVVPIARRAAERGVSVFLLGGEPGVADRARAALVAAAPGLQVAGVHCPPFGFEDDEEQLATIERALIEAAPGIVLLALSFPKTDNLIRRLKPVLPRTSFMGVGIALSFVAGERRRAPAWMRRWGLEWLHRVLSEPRRLWRRYLLHGLPFAAHLLAAAYVVRVQRALGGPWYAHPEDVPEIGAAQA